jgi:hypothetical protein
LKGKIMNEGLRQLALEISQVVNVASARQAWLDRLKRWEAHQIEMAREASRQQDEIASLNYDALTEAEEQIVSEVSQSIERLPLATGLSVTELQMRPDSDELDWCMLLSVVHDIFVDPDELYPNSRLVPGWDWPAFCLFKEYRRPELGDLDLDLCRKWLETLRTEPIKASATTDEGTQGKGAPATATEAKLKALANEVEQLKAKLDAPPQEKGESSAKPKGANQGNSGDGDRYAVLSTLGLAHKKAYLSFLYAETKAKRRLQDRDAFDWLKENGIDVESEELADYTLPEFDTWCRYLRYARNATSEKKYTPRTQRTRSD